MGASPRLSYTLHGAANGPVVLALDGPASRQLPRAASKAAADLGIRLVAPDRPGFFDTPAQPGRRIVDFPSGAVELMDRLGIARAGVLAMSGGTPYALALAAAAPQRVNGLAFCGAIVPLAEPGALEGVRGELRFSARAARFAPWILRFLLRAAARAPRRFAERELANLPHVDREVLADPEYREVQLRTSEEALAYWATTVEESRLIVRDWGINLAAVKAPASFWAGAEDGTHPTAMSRKLAARLGGAPVHVVPESGAIGLMRIFPEALAFAARDPREAAALS